MAPRSAQWPRPRSRAMVPPMAPVPPRGSIPSNFLLQGARRARRGGALCDGGLGAAHGLGRAHLRREPGVGREGQRGDGERFDHGGRERETKRRGRGRQLSSKWPPLFSVFR